MLRDLPGSHGSSATKRDNFSLPQDTASSILFLGSSSNHPDYGMLWGAVGEESGEMSTAWPHLSVRQNFLKESWRSVQPNSEPEEEGDTQVQPPGKDCHGNRGVRRVLQHFLRESSTLTLLNVTTVPKSLCGPGVRQERCWWLPKLWGTILGCN